MPAQYEAIKASEKKAGKSDKEAKRIAAATYNKNRPAGAKPVTGHYDKKVLHKVAKGLKKAFPE